MKKLTPQVFFSWTIVFFAFSLSAVAQTKSEQAVIKEWLIANQDKITLVSSQEYQKMSPSVRAVLDADKQTLVYDKEVTQKDLEGFEARNDKGTYVSFEVLQKRAEKSLDSKGVEHIAEEKYKVSTWLTTNQKKNIKIISRQDYEGRSAQERQYIDNLSDKIIYEGEKVTWKDIEAFEKKKH